MSTLGALFSGHVFALEMTKFQGQKPNLISEIKLSTKISPKTMIEFYNGLLNLKVLYQTLSSVSFKTGASVLTFNCDAEQDASPFYHFAFNIPEKKIRQAEEWQLKRTEIIEPPNHLKDTPDFGKNIVYFRHWNAHSIFFYDPAGNLVEYIARHTLPDSTIGRFSEKDILYISEIGLVVNSVPESYEHISSHFCIQEYSISSDRFLAMGDETGLLLLMAKGGRAVFQQGRKRDIFETEILLNGLKDLSSMNLQAYPYHLLTST